MKLMIKITIIVSICFLFMMCTSKPDSKTEDTATGKTQSEPVKEESAIAWGVQLGTEKQDTIEGVIVDKEDNVVIAGTTSGAIGERNIGNSDGFIVKFSNNGKEIYRLQIGTNLADDIKRIICDQDNNIIVVGSTDGTLGESSFGGKDIFVSKYTTSGKLLWITQYGSDKTDAGTAITCDEKNNYYITGITGGRIGSVTLGNQDAFLTKMDSEGSILWTTQIGTAYYDMGRGVTTDKNGNVYVVTGYYQSNIASIIILSGNGEIINQIDVPNQNFLDIYVNDSDEVFVAGSLKGVSQFMKYDKDLNPVWVKNWSHGNWTGEKKIIPLQNGLYATSGCMNWPDCYGFVRTYDKEGNVKDLVKIRQSFTGAKTTCGYELAIDSKGALYHVGFTQEDLFGVNNGSNDGFLVKVVL
ncbi:MAG: SBBP repeat-containing protein [Spirochaetales bacterium]|nr:SBBP repeat-containing protein [Spirochaetales bacterium]